MTDRNRKSISVTWVILLFLVVASGGYLLLQMWQTSLRAQKINLEKAIQSLTNEFLLAEISLQTTTPELSGQIIFSIPSGKRVQNTAFEMVGQDLFVEFQLVTWLYHTNQFVFGYPMRLYSDAVAPADGIDVLTSFTNNLDQTIDEERLVYLLLSRNKPEEITIQHRQTIAVHQYPGRPWKESRYQIIHRQDGTVELREK